MEKNLMNRKRALKIVNMTTAKIFVTGTSAPAGSGSTIECWIVVPNWPVVEPYTQAG